MEDSKNNKIQIMSAFGNEKSFREVSVHGECWILLNRWANGFFCNSQCFFTLVVVVVVEWLTPVVVVGRNFAFCTNPRSPQMSDDYES